MQNNKLWYVNRFPHLINIQNKHNQYRLTLDDKNIEVGNPLYLEAVQLISFELLDQVKISTEIGNLIGYQEGKFIDTRNAVSITPY